MKKYVVFGANGFIGSHLTETLSGSSKVMAVDTFSVKPTFVRNKNIEVIKADVTKDSRKIKNLAKKRPNGVVWAVGGVIPSDSLDGGKKIFGMVEPFLEISKFFLERKIKVVLTSSAGMLYLSRKEPLDENNEVQPWTWYGLQKLIFEEILTLLAKEFDSKVTILRITSVYGERQPTDRNQGVIAKLMKSIIKKQTFTLYGSSNARRDYIYVKDLSRIIELVLDKTMKYNVYNVSTGSGHSILDVKRGIEKISGEKIKMVKDKKRLMDPSHIDVSNKRLMKEFKDFKFTSFEEGLEKTLEWYRRI